MSYLDGLNDNLPLLEDLYEKYLQDPSSIDPSWHPYFDHMDVVAYREVSADIRIRDLINAYRTYGHLEAKFNPIEIKSREKSPELSLEHLGFSTSELGETFPTNGLMEHPTATLQEIIDSLRKVYCANIGIEYTPSEELNAWLQHRFEQHPQSSLTIEQKKMLLQHLNKSELFEVFLHTKYVGQKRFSLEGAETLIPMLAAAIDLGSLLGIEDFVLGMPHRGRLNVLCNILDKSYSTIFAEFDEGYIPVSFEGSGDVKYHKGFFSSYETMHGKNVNVSLTPNPSHLESVDPVVEGIARAKQTLKNKKKVIPVLIHGDAAIAAQGVVYETLQMYNLDGFSTGGTIHFVVNNQIGFTTNPKDGRSTRYCTDIAKAFGAPVFHVNAENPESCVFVTNLAVEIRQKFNCDVFIDLNCYRKYGHNESDEPAFTQPLEYKLIREKRPIREVYRDALIQENILEKKIVDAFEEEFKESLQTQMAIKNEEKAAKDVIEKTARKPEISKQILLDVTKALSHLPEGFSIHPKLDRLVKERLAMVEEDKPIDWGMAETLAYGTILWEGGNIRISGQDVCRGTFSHRHALWMDQVKEQAYFPLQHLKPNQGRFDIYNSPLTEYAGLGFEYGYSLVSPDDLVIWEAQFGDFCNGAQITIDQYISSGEQKWGHKNSIVMLLPHGYEGQGPEHSSGRMERFLTLCGNNNMRIVYPTLPAQIFHVLHRQIESAELKPLIVFTPKGLLRHPECISKVDDLIKGSFEEIIDDPLHPRNAKHAIFCTGRIYYDLLAERSKRKLDNLAIIRIEQLYPLNMEKIKEILKQYTQADRFTWAQEEPKNMGAWSFIHPYLQSLMPKIEYTGRDFSASPAAGSYYLHKKEYAAIMQKIFNDSEQKK